MEESLVTQLEMGGICKRIETIFLIERKGLFAVFALVGRNTRPVKGDLNNPSQIFTSSGGIRDVLSSGVWAT
jgi:hypothetical protein